MNAGTCLALLALLSTSALAENNLRDPFVPTDPASVSTPTRPELRVTGLLQSEDHYLAIVRYHDQSRILQVGDRFAGTQVLSISPEGVTLLVIGDERRVSLGEKSLNLSFQYAFNYGLDGSLAKNSR